MTFPPERGDILITVSAYSEKTINVIDLSNEDRTCDDLNFGALDGVQNPQSLHGTFIGGSLLVCGDSRYDCLTYDIDAQDWFRTVERNIDRFIPYGIDMDGYHWVSGGDYLGLEDSSELYDGTSATFQFAADLPVPTRDHCVVQIGADEALVMAGEHGGPFFHAPSLTISYMLPGYDNLNQVYSINARTGAIDYKASAPLTDSRDLLLPQCGSALKSDGTEVVVLTGGLYSGATLARVTSYVYDVAGDFWIPGGFFINSRKTGKLCKQDSFAGPDLPESRTWGRAVQYDNTFVLVGGGDEFSASGDMRADILRYDPNANEWIRLPQTLPNPDFVNVALLAPEDFPVNCT